MSNAADFVMPFGRHQGRPLSTVPRGYLHWLLDNAKDLRPETRQAITAYLGTASPPTPPPEQDPTTRIRGERKRRAVDPPTCGRCGLPGSKARPLVHADCATDQEIPF